ncbi:MAG: cyclic nucleotide-binding domain-containing protein [Comamonadaceae bacterium]|nr:cyclic nucleotide-binding domain-containing protein [Comamonadaceae bacterium]
MWWGSRKKDREGAEPAAQWVQTQAPAEPGQLVEQQSESESVLFQSLILPHAGSAQVIVPWSARAQELGARRIGQERGIGLLQAAWARQSPSQPFNRQELALLGGFFEYHSLPADREIIQQDEYGDYMMVQLNGVMAVERAGPNGQPVRMAETHVGDLIGEMSLLDQGLRFSSCVSLTPCELAVLTRDGLDEMMHNQAQLAARLVLLLARKLSVRLRAVSSKLK